MVMHGSVAGRLDGKDIEWKSKETYGQTRGLSNLEMKHVGKLAIIGALLKAVKTSCVHTMQGRTYLIKHRVFSWPLLHTELDLAGDLISQT